MTDNDGMYYVNRFYLSESEDFMTDCYGRYEDIDIAIDRANEIKNGCVVMRNNEIVYPSNLSEILLTI